MSVSPARQSRNESSMSSPVWSSSSNPPHRVTTALRSPRLQLCANGNRPWKSPGPALDRPAAHVGDPGRVQLVDVERPGHELVLRRAVPIALHPAAADDVVGVAHRDRFGAGGGDAVLRQYATPGRSGRVHQPDPGVAGGEAGDDLPRRVARPVVDDEQLPRLGPSRRRGARRAGCRWSRPRPGPGDHDAQHRRPVVGHGVRAPATSSASAVSNRPTITSGSTSSRPA